MNVVYLQLCTDFSEGYWFDDATLAAAEVRQIPGFVCECVSLLCAAFATGRHPC